MAWTTDAAIDLFCPRCGESLRVGALASGHPLDMPRFHPWAAPLAVAVIVCTGVLLVGLVLLSAGLRAGGWLAMGATALLCVVLLPLFTFAVHARHPDEPRRGVSRWIAERRAPHRDGRVGDRSPSRGHERAL
jgi:hypothetical protein